MSVIRSMNFFVGFSLEAIWEAVLVDVNANGSDLLKLLETKLSILKMLNIRFCVPPF